MKSKILLFLGVTIFALTISCNKDDTVKNYTGGGGGKTVSPSNPNGLTSVLVVPGANIITGTMPAPTGNPTSPIISMVDSTVSWSAGGQVQLPIQFSNNGSGSDICGLYFQVNGAGSYFNVPINPTTYGKLILPISIPSNVASGKFCITISLYDCNTPSSISNTFTTCITVTQPMTCNTKKQSGGEGVTSTLHNLGQTAGYVSIDYETYVAPDRIDIFYGGVWVAGTGSSVANAGSIPVLADCNNPTEGYVGQKGKLCFLYDPAIGTQVEVVVSGCLRGGTIWDYTINCPNSTPCPNIMACGMSTTSGGNGVTTTMHTLGSGSGNVVINYDMFAVADQMDVYYKGVKVTSTNGPVSNIGQVSFYYNYAGEDFITIVITGGNGTSWNYTVNCPI